jgi:cation diffusion facilitator CzcD-associated flavoprotein CzcO
MTQPFRRPVDVEFAIVGSGFAGLGLAIRLKRRGEEDFVVLERASDVGGTWRDNRYPGVECDVPSHLYSFSFRTNPNWSRVFSPGQEIQQYLCDSAREEGIVPHIRFDADVLDASWDASASRWMITTAREVLAARYLISATGHLADEHLPAVPGLDSFPGAKFHSARWQDIELSGKRIGVVGTGASAIQVIPQLARVASHLVVFQRTPAYVSPRRDRDYTEGEKRRFRRDPRALEELRSELFWVQETNYAARRQVPQYIEPARRVALDHLAAQVPDPGLRQRLTPAYEFGCKRTLFSNTFYPALQQPNVTLEASALASVNGATSRAASGAGYELDALIFATGFEATEPPFAKRVHGAHGISLSEHWSTGMRALDSISVSRFPNLFIINGPNTSLGHNSVVYIIESQVQYILETVDYNREHSYTVFEATPEAEEAYVGKMQRDARGSVWVDGGCRSWYIDRRSGKLTLIWPDFAFAFRARNGRFRPGGYRFTGAAEFAALADSR